MLRVLSFVLAVISISIDLTSANCDVANGYKYQVITNPNQPAGIWPPVDENFSPCAGNYTAYIYSGDPDAGLTGLQFSGFEPIDGQEAHLTIINSDGSVFGIVTDDASGNKLKDKITTPNITLEWVQIGNKAYGFTGQIKRAAGKPETTTLLTTPTPMQTRSYSGQGKDPWLITHDLLIAIDNGKKPNADTWDMLKLLVLKFDAQLRIYNGTADEAPIYYTRQSLIGLGPFQTSPYTPIWGLDSDAITEIVPTMRNDIINKAAYVNSLSNAADLMFQIVTDNTNPKFSYSTRPNAQRTVLIFTDSIPSDWDEFSKLATNGGALAKKFQDYDIKLLVVGLGLDADSLSKFSDEGNWFAFFDAPDNSMDVVNQLLQNDLLTANKLCPINKDMQDQTVDETTTTSVFIQEPFNYMGPTDQTKKKWDNGGGQTARYCNFQSNTYVIHNQVKDGQNQGAICLTIYNQLEVDRDFVHVFKGTGQEKKAIASFTGLEVLGSRMEIYDNVTVTFETNPEEVYGGFYLKADAGPCPNSLYMRPAKIYRL